MRRRIIAIAVTAALLASSSGCLKPVHFPSEPLPSPPEDNKVFSAFDANHDGKADFFTYVNAAGRVWRIGYDTNNDARADVNVDLDAIYFAQCRHLVIILDGFGYDLVKKYYDNGGLRMFHAPSRVVAPYPSITDPSLEDILGYMPCRAFEARYFDRRSNRLAGGSSDYLTGINEPYNRLLQYRAKLIWDAIGYVEPWPVFGKEINDAKRVFDKAATQEMLAYFVSSAGVSTRLGAAGQVKCLRRVDQLVNQVVWETRGLTKITLLSDHGHTYTTAKRIELEKYLAKKGWRLANSLRGPKDAAFILFGLVTFGSFATNKPQALASDLIGAEGVDLASFADKDAAVVLGADSSRAIIRRSPSGRYKYEALSGDPLQLKGILARLGSDREGYYDADELLKATITHTWPAPLQRLWRAHFALVQNPPDVIVSLADGFYAGSRSFAGTVDIASTHGGLNYKNSVTFIMSTAGPLPPVMRTQDVPVRMRELTKNSWPAGR